MLSVGRPRIPFILEYCDMLIAHCSKGYTYESFAAVLSIGRRTLYEWEKEYPEFAHAKVIAMEKQQHQWQMLTMGHITGKIKGNTAALIWGSRTMAKWAAQDQPLQLEENKAPLTIDITGNDDDIQGA